MKKSISLLLISLCLVGGLVGYCFYTRVQTLSFLPEQNLGWLYWNKNKLTLGGWLNSQYSGEQINRVTKLLSLLPVPDLSTSAQLLVTPGVQEILWSKVSINGYEQTIIIVAANQEPGPFPGWQRQKINSKIFLFLPARLESEVISLKPKIFSWRQYTVNQYSLFGAVDSNHSKSLNQTGFSPPDNFYLGFWLYPKSVQFYSSKNFSFCPALTQLINYFVTKNIYQLPPDLKLLVNNQSTKQQTKPPLFFANSINLLNSLLGQKLLTLNQAEKEQLIAELNKNWSLAVDQNDDWNLTLESSDAKEQEEIKVLTTKIIATFNLQKQSKELPDKSTVTEYQLPELKFVQDQPRLEKMTYQPNKEIFFSTKNNQVNLGSKFIFNQESYFLPSKKRPIIIWRSQEEQINLIIIFSGVKAYGKILFVDNP